jgi:hypothetical protein
MTNIKKHPPSLDEILADFTDHALNENNTLVASSTDEELSSLEETILRLQQTLSREGPDKATLNRLQADFRSRLRSAERSSRSTWQSRQSRQRWTLAFIAIAFVVAIFFTFPLSLVDSGNTQATAGLQPQNVTPLLLAGGIIIGLVLWLSRRQ